MLAIFSILNKRNNSIGSLDFKVISYENLQDFIAYRLLPHTSNVIFYWIKLRLISWYREYERTYWYSTWRKLFRLLFSQGNELEHAKIGLFASQQYKSTKCTRKRKCVYQEYYDTSIWRKKDHKIYTNKILSNNFDILIKYYVMIIYTIMFCDLELHIYIQV